MDKKTKGLWWDVVRHGFMLGCWIVYIALLWGYALGKVKVEEIGIWTLIAILTTLVDVVEEVKKRPPVDVVVEMAVKLDRPARITDVKTKLNGKEPISSSGPSRVDASAVEEDKAKMN